MRRGKKIAPARVQAGKFFKLQTLKAARRSQRKARGQRTTTTCMAYTSLSVSVYAILCGRQVRCYASSRVSTTTPVPPLHCRWAVSATKFIADAQRIIGGQLRVFQRVERTADGKPGELAFSGNTETYFQSLRCSSIGVFGTRKCSSLRSFASRTFTPFLARYSRWQGLPAYVPAGHRPGHPAG